LRKGSWILYSRLASEFEIILPALFLTKILGTNLKMHHE
jgi:hypothetical protein